MKNIVTGFVAHVDAGKTTLSESLLYLSGVIRHQGRVDHKDTLLDFDDQERDHGITIFSKVTSFDYHQTHFTILDTPGHVDFSGEMERALSVLDYAVVIINGIDGVQSHTKTIWRLLDYYHIPAFLFVNKMDITYKTKDDLLNELSSLSNNIVDIENCDDEDLATFDDELLDEYMDHSSISVSALAQAIRQRHVFPVLFGSALKNEKTKELLEMLDTYTLPHPDHGELSTICYKVDHDEKGERLVYLRIYSGHIHTKEEINGEKINQIRVYQGNKYVLADEAEAGEVIIVTGLKKMNIGDAIGKSIRSAEYLKPYMHYQLHIPHDEHQDETLRNIKMLGEEEPLLNLTIHNADNIEVSLMGEIQIEILKAMIKERFNADVSIDSQQINYLETITEPVEGVGHFEPLRHYAEVHLLLEPLPTGSGIEYENKCLNDLAEHYQRLIMTHLKEKIHLGVLTGSPITDIRITLLGGKASEKHTSGGDFREATYRAVRQGLMKAHSVVLEPYGTYELTIPTSDISKVFYDFNDYEAPVIKDDNGQTAILKGKAPLSFLNEYSVTLLNTTKGEGLLSIDEHFYAPAKDQLDIINKINYDPEADLDNPTGSIFCTRGAGYYVPFNEVKTKMHLPSFIKEEKETNIPHHNRNYVSDEEVKRIYEATYGKEEIRLTKDFYGSAHADKKIPANMTSQKPECLLVDGYNMIFAWDELRELADVNISLARDRLIDIMSSYQGYRDCTLIIVFDAYKVTHNAGSEIKYNNIYIVYTKEAQTADAYIERTTKEISSKYHVIVATSDNAEQTIVIGHGATRISAREFKDIVESTNQHEQREYQRKNPVLPDTPLDKLKK